MGLPLVLCNEGVMLLTLVSHMGDPTGEEQGEEPEAEGRAPVLSDNHLRSLFKIPPLWVSWGSITKHHELGGLEQKWTPPWVWRPEV